MIANSVYKVTATTYNARYKIAAGTTTLALTGKLVNRIDYLNDKPAGKYTLMLVLSLGMYRCLFKRVSTNSNKDV